MTTLLGELPILALDGISYYLGINELRALRLVNRFFSGYINSFCSFNVPLTNASLHWLKKCHLKIDQVIIGSLTNEDFIQWPDNSYADVKTLRCRSEAFSKRDGNPKIVQKLFKVFPNIRNIILQCLTTKAVSEILEIKMIPQNKLKTNMVFDVPRWNLINSLTITNSHLRSVQMRIFKLLSKRTYPHLTSLHLAYRLEDPNLSETDYSKLYEIYLCWMEFIGNHAETLKKLTLKQDFGIEFDIDYVMIFEDTLSISLDSPRFAKIFKKFSEIHLEEIYLKIQLHVDSTDLPWSWSKAFLATSLLEAQRSLISIKLDCCDCVNNYRPLPALIQNNKNTLKSFTCITSSERSLELDLKIFKDTKLEYLELASGWSRGEDEWSSSSPLKLFNAKHLPLTLKTLNLGKADALDPHEAEDNAAYWISKNLINLRQVSLPVTFNRVMLTNFLQLPKLKTFTLYRNSEAEIKLKDIVHLCKNAKGITFQCPTIKTYDTAGKWMDLLVVNIFVNRSIFTFHKGLETEFPKVITSTQSAEDVHYKFHGREPVTHWFPQI